MHEEKERVLIITNLYPLPWQRNRAVFNFQQFNAIREEFELKILVPVAFLDWYRNWRKIEQTDSLRYVPYFYTPKIGRRFYSFFMFVSIFAHAGFWIRRVNPKLIFASWAFPDAVAAGWLARLLNCRFMFKVHGTDINDFASYPSRARQIRAAAERASCVVSVSRALVDKMVKIGISEDKARVVYNGIDHAVFGSAYELPYQRDYILFVGNLLPEKGVLELLNGFAGISSSYPNVDLVIIGDGILRERLAVSQESLRLSGRVKILGSTDHADIAAWMTHAKLTALPSSNEGVPNVLLESMACGTPVLATDVGGIPEVVSNPDVGVLIDANGSAEISAALIEMLETRWDRRKIKNHARRYSWDINRTELAELMRDAMQ